MFFRSNASLLGQTHVLWVKYLSFFQILVLWVNYLYCVYKLCQLFVVCVALVYEYAC